MKAIVSSQSLGTVAPYIVSAALMLPPMASTARTTVGIPAEVCVFVDVARQHHARPVDALASYTWDISRPELTPDIIIRPINRDAFDAYRPFVASEGWREISVPEGPFLVEEEPRERPFFDDYDLSAIALYEQQ